MTAAAAVEGMSRVRVGRALAAFAVVAGMVGIAVLAGLGRWDFMLRDFQAQDAVIAIGFGIVAWVALPGQSRNGAVWVLTLAAGFSAFHLAGTAYAVAAAGDPSLDAVLRLTPPELPAAARYALVVFEWAQVPGLGLVITLGVLLFPEGRFATRLDRALGRASLAMIALVSAGMAWSERPTSTLPLGATSGYTGPGRLIAPGTVVLLATSVYAVVVLLRRFRSSRGESRQQYRWILLGMGVLAAGLVASAAMGPLLSTDTVRSLIELAVEAVAVAAYGLALARYRLWEIDVVLRKSIVFVLLAAFITAVYSLVAVGLGEMVGGSSLWLSLLATAVVAVAFEPARARAQRWASRLVYGRRASPYEVLAEITGRLASAESDERLLARSASLLAAATGAARAGVWLANGDGLATAAVSPLGEPLLVPDLAALPGAVEAIEQDGELLGALTVEKSRGDSVSAGDQALMADLAGATALVLRRRRLEADLREAARQLERSRRRLVSVQDAERRRLERELREGAEQWVAAVAVGLEDVQRLAEDEQTPTAASLIAQLVADARKAVEEIHSLARGLFPPLLEAEGLGAALPELAARSALEVRLDADVSRRHRLDLEGAVYFCIAEALTNACKHGRAPVSVQVSDREGRLCFEVTDSGPGFDPRRATPGAGLRNIGDRLDTLGGSLTIRSRPGEATTVAGAVPVEAMAIARASPATRRRPSQGIARQAATSRSESKADLQTKPTAPAASAGCAYSS